MKEDNPGPNGDNQLRKMGVSFFV